jgi:hypothetical protein
MAQGAIKARVDKEMPEIIKNIMDVNTKATAKRKLQLTLEFTPDEDRNQVIVKCVVKKTLEPTNPVMTTLYVRKTGEDSIQAVEATAQIPGQQAIDGTEQAQPAELLLFKNA